MRAKSFDAFEESEFCGPLGPLLLDFPYPFSQHAPVVVKPATSFRQFGQVDHLSLIGINEPHHFPIQGGKRALQASALLVRADIHRGVSTPLLILGPQHGWVRQPRLHMLPDACFSQCCTEAAACACPRRIPRIAQGAAIAAALGPPRAHHAPAAVPPDDQPPPRIRMLRVVPLRTLAMPGQLPLRPVPGLGSDERGHPARNPFALGAPRAALALTELALCEPPPPVWAPHI